MATRLQEAQKPVKCLICKVGQMEAGFVTVTLEPADTTLVIKRVPALVCDNCGEEYVDEAVAADLMHTARMACEAAVQVEVREYAAAPTG